MYIIYDAYMWVEAKGGLCVPIYLPVSSPCT